MRRHALALMTSPEIGSIPKEDSVLLLPVGCVEQHGPAGYVGADSILAEHVAARELHRQHQAAVAILYPWKLAITWAKENVPEMSGEIGHGGEPTISVMMALAPGVVDTSVTAKRGYTRSDGDIDVTSYRSARFDGQDVGLFSDPTTILPSGASGDWTSATQERGGLVLDYVIDFAARFVKSFAVYQATNGSARAQAQ